METKINGNNIRIVIEANELTTTRATIALPEGYSFETIHITYSTNIGEIEQYLSISNQSYTFPPVRSHSPSTFSIYMPDRSKRAEIRLIIEKFGQIPDPHYFDKPFTPILVTDDDGNKYKVIPSDQFK